jgi:hypothetical protein
MHVDQPLGSGALMKVINILRHQEQFAGPSPIEPRERIVGGVRLHCLQVLTSCIIELVHQGRGLPKTLRRSHVFHAVPFPQPIRGSEGRDSAFCRYARAGQDDDVTDVLHQAAIPRGPSLSKSYDFCKV